SEISGRAELAGQLPIESQVDVNLAVTGTIKGPGCRARKAARGLDLPAEQHQHGTLVVAAHLLKVGAPHILGLAEDGAYEIDLRVVAYRSGLIGRRLHLLRIAAVQEREERLWAHAHEVADDDDHQGADADTAASSNPPGASLIFDVVAA